jgi:hypothetical protein
MEYVKNFYKDFKESDNYFYLKVITIVVAFIVIDIIIIKKIFQYYSKKIPNPTNSEMLMRLKNSKYLEESNKLKNSKYLEESNKLKNSKYLEKKDSTPRTYRFRVNSEKSEFKREDYDFHDKREKIFSPRKRVSNFLN